MNFRRKSIRLTITFFFIIMLLLPVNLISTVFAPTHYTVQVNSGATDGAWSNSGRVWLETYGNWDYGFNALLTTGVYDIVAGSSVQPGYSFDKWEYSGSVSIENVESKNTRLHVSGSGTVRAKFFKWDISIQASPASQSIPAGSVAAYEITLTAGVTWSSPGGTEQVLVVVEPSGYPSGASFSIGSPSTLTQSSRSTTLTYSQYTSESTIGDTYSITLTATITLTSITKSTSVQLTVIPQIKDPDLVVVSVSSSDSSPVEGDEVTFSYTVKNQGEGDSSGFLTSIWMKTPDHVLISTDDFKGTLPSGETHSGTFPETWTAISGSCSFEVKVDSADWVDEGSFENNNMYYFDLTGETGTGVLSIDTIPIKGEVIVDGISWGIAPQSKTVSIGVHQVTFGDVEGYVTPSSKDAVQVNPDAVTEIIEEYYSSDVTLDDVLSLSNDISLAIQANFDLWESDLVDYTIKGRADLTDEYQAGDQIQALLPGWGDLLGGTELEVILHIISTFDNIEAILQFHGYNINDLSSLKDAQVRTKVAQLIAEGYTITDSKGNQYLVKNDAEYWKNIIENRNQQFITFLNSYQIQPELYDDLHTVLSDSVIPSLENYHENIVKGINGEGLVWIESDKGDINYVVIGHQNQFTNNLDSLFADEGKGELFYKSVALGAGVIATGLMVIGKVALFSSPVTGPAGIALTACSWAISWGIGTFTGLWSQYEVATVTRTHNEAVFDQLSGLYKFSSINNEIIAKSQDQLFDNIETQLNDVTSVSYPRAELTGVIIQNFYSNKMARVEITFENTGTLPITAQGVIQIKDEQGNIIGSQVSQSSKTVNSGTNDFFWIYVTIPVPGSYSLSGKIRFYHGDTLSETGEINVGFNVLNNSPEIKITWPSLTSISPGDLITINTLIFDEETLPSELDTKLTITDPNNVQQRLNQPMTREEEGNYFYYEWQTSEQQEVGQYKVEIIVIDKNGGTTSSIEDNIFTIDHSNLPPDSPIDPSPIDEATNIAVDSTLSWSCSDPDADTLSYDIYFGIESSPPSISQEVVNSYYDPGQLSSFTTYYWKVVATDGELSTSSPIWSFTTVSSVNTLTIQVSGSGTTDPPPGVYECDEGEVFPVDAIPDAGWMLDHWELGGINVGSDDTIIVTMDGDHTLTAVFTFAQKFVHFGDLIISNGTIMHIHDINYTQNGDIIVMLGGTLIIENSIVNINQTYVRQYWLYVYPNGILTVNRSTFTSPYELDIIIDGNGTLSNISTGRLIDFSGSGNVSLFDSTIDFYLVGYSDYQLVTYPWPYNGTLSVRNSTIRAIEAYGVSSVLINKSTVGGIECWQNTTWIVHNSTIEQMYVFSQPINPLYYGPHISIFGSNLKLFGPFYGSTDVSVHNSNIFYLNMINKNIFSYFISTNGNVEYFINAEYSLKDYSSVKIFNSVINGWGIRLRFGNNSAVSLNDLPLYRVKLWNLYLNNTIQGVNYNLTLYDTVTNSWRIDAYNNADILIHNSSALGPGTLIRLEAYENSTISIYNSNDFVVGGIDNSIISIYDSSVRPWVIQYFSGNSTLYFVNSSYTWGPSFHTEDLAQVIFCWYLTIQVSGYGITNPLPDKYTYEVGSQVIVDALPTSGWTLDHWEMDGINVSSDDSINVTIDDNHILKAVFTSDYISTTPTFLSLKIFSNAYIGSITKIDGKLTYENGSGISGTNILLEYSVTGGSQWSAITSTETDSDGNFSVEWIPTATGNYIVRASASETPSLGESRDQINLASLPFEDEYIFSVISNSTITNLDFSSTRKELSFTVAGPPNTLGYTNVTIAKTLIENIEELQVHIDGSELDYIIKSTSDSWIIHFTYRHSSHSIVLSLTQPPNQPPVADANGPYSSTQGKPIIFNGAESDDPEGPITSYIWDFGDDNTGTGVTVSHTYSSAGTYTVNLTVTDGDGLTDSDTATATVSKPPSSPSGGGGIIVPNKPPVAEAGPDREVYVGVTIHLNGAGSHDPDGTINEYHWFPGDGSHKSGITVKHVYEEAGNYTVSLSVTDNNGATSTDECTVTVESPPAPISDDVSEEISANQTSYVLDASDDTDTTVKVNTKKTVIVTVIKYESNPHPEDPMPEEGVPKYADILISDPDAVVWPIYVEMSYTDEEIEGLNESSLGIYYWFNETWQRCSDTGVDPERNVVWAYMTAEEASGSPILIGGTIPLEPAEFVVSYLDIEPRQIELGGTITISVNVTNVGEETGSYNVTLNVEEGLIISVKEVTLQGGESEIVEFEFVPEAKGTYDVDIEGMIGTIYVIIPIPVPPLPPYLSNLTVTPTEIEIGDNVTISLDIRNMDNQSITYIVTMRIDELTLLVDVELESYEAKTVSRTMTPDIIGEYHVYVQDLTGGFTVKAPPEPAGFELSNLTITPKEIEIGEEVTVSFVITNADSRSFVYVPFVQIGEITIMDGVELEGYESKVVVYVINQETVGNFEVEVDGLKDSFTVKPKPPFWMNPVYIVVIIIILTAGSIIASRRWRKLLWITSD